MNTAIDEDGGAPRQTLNAAQANAAQAGLRTLVTWSLATTEPEDVLLDALRRENPAEVTIGLATVGRMLAVELGIRSGRDEVSVLADLRGLLNQVQTP